MVSAAFRLITGVVGGERQLVLRAAQVSLRERHDPGLV